MADFVQLRPGMRVMIPSPDGALGLYYSSAIRRIDKRGVLMDIPRLEGEDLPVEAGQTLRMFIQLHGRLYECTGRVRTVDLQVLLEEPGEAKRTERREFFRLMLTIPARAWLIREEQDTDGDEVEDTGPPQEVTILDLSGGGVRIRTDQEWPVGARIELEFSLDGPPIHLDAEVIRTAAIELARGGKRHEAHCMFTDIKTSEQDRLVRFVFQKQREFSQKGVA